MGKLSSLAVSLTMQKRCSLIVLVLILFPISTGIAQSRTNTSGATGLGTGGAGQPANLTAPTGNTGTELDVSAGSSEGVSRDFGSGFVGGSDTSGRFVGSQFAGDQNLNAQSLPNFQQLQRQRAARPTEPSKVSKVRPVLRIGFDVSRSFAPRNGLNVSQAAARLPDRPEFAEVQFESSAPDTIRLTGRVADERSRKLAEIFYRMEPGVRQIINEIQVR